MRTRTSRGSINTRLLGLLVGGVAATLAGVSVVVFVPRPVVTRADLLDAGITVDTTPRRLSCWACGEACGDGGCCQLSTVAAVEKTPSAGQDRKVIFPRSALKLRAYVDQFGEAGACRVTTLTWPQVAAFDAEPADEVPSCRCLSRANPGTCRLLDAGLPNLTQTYEPTDVTGACVPTLCGGPAGSNPLSGACR